MSSTAGSRRWRTVRLSMRVASASIARFGVTFPPFPCGGGGGGIAGLGLGRSVVGGGSEVGLAL